MILGRNQPTEADFWGTIRNLGWTDDEQQRLKQIMELRGQGWPWLLDVMRQTRLGTTAAEPCLAWLANLTHLQVEVLSHFDEPLDTARWPACSATATEADDIQAELVSNGRMSIVVRSWWIALGQDAAFGYGAGLTIGEAIALRDRDENDTIRMLAALRAPTGESVGL